jgi:c-di-GMP-binding flagellar brake protein YcgR
MFLDTQPAPVGEADGSDPLAEFQITGAAEICGFLRVLLDRSLPVRINSARGQTISTCLQAIDPASNTLSFSADVDLLALEGLLQAGRASAVAYDDSVKYQFLLTGLNLARGTQSARLQCDVPKSMYRFQRRSFYRAKVAGRGAPTAKFRHPADPGLALTLRVLDVSVGGCGLLLPEDAPEIPEGTKLTEVRLELDSDSRHLLSLVVRSGSEMLGDNGDLAGSRLGCEWINLSGQAERALQFYVDNLQKRRRMLARR